MNFDDRRRYRRLKILTTVGPTLFVAVAETFRFYYLRLVLPPASVSLVAVAVTLVGAAGFSTYVFDVVEKMENERQQYKDAMLALQERERLAREMHDGLAQNLAAINLNVHRAKKLLESKDYPGLDEELGHIQSAVNLSYTEVRQSLYDLKASQTLQQGFWKTLHKQSQDFERSTGIPVKLEPLPEEQEPWNDSTAVQILRIVQESLANVRKHAAAKLVIIRAIREDNRVKISIIDDGKGFVPVPAGEVGHHFGLSIMEERAESVGGRVTIHSQPGVGTTVTIILALDGQRGGDNLGKGKTYVGG